MDEIAIRKGHEYRIVVSDLERATVIRVDPETFPCHRTKSPPQETICGMWSAVDVGETDVSTVEAVRQLLVVHPQQVQYRRVEVVDRDGCSWAL